MCAYSGGTSDVKYTNYNMITRSLIIKIAVFRFIVGDTLCDSIGYKPLMYNAVDKCLHLAGSVNTHPFAFNFWVQTLHQMTE